MSERRVVVTGLGMLTPLGQNVASCWSNILKGESGIRKIASFNVENAPCKIAGLIDRSPETGFDPEKFIDPKDIKKMDLFISYGVAAAIEAVEDSGWKPEREEDRDRTGVIIGSGIGGLNMIETTSVEFHAKNSSRVSPFFIPSSLINLLSGHLSIKYGFSGPNHSVVTACSTGAHAIGDAFRIVKYGDADVMVAGGSESPVTPVGLAGFASAKALSTKYNDDPSSASRPWDRDRDGFVMGEGAGILVLEEYEHAKRRGAKIYSEIVGYGLTGDAYHITAPHPEGRGAYRAMSNALRDAGIGPEDIDYINAHGTSTPMGDAIEIAAVQRLFLDKNPKVSMSSTKSATGHLLGATGSVEAIFSILAGRDKVIPPTLNLYNPMEEAKIDLTPLKPKERAIKYALSNSFGFGGTNASLVIKNIS